MARTMRRLAAVALLAVSGVGVVTATRAPMQHGAAASVHAARILPDGLGMGQCPPHPVNGCLVVPPGSHAGGQ
jgi:hypothetical protein